MHARENMGGHNANATASTATRRAASLSTAVRDACASLVSQDGVLPSPESVADAAAEAVRLWEAANPLEAAAAADAHPNSPDSPKQKLAGEQGEYRFPRTAGIHAPYGTRFATALAAARTGDAAAMHTAGLLLYYGSGGAPQDSRRSAEWHAAAAARGNLDALAVLGGCVRNGVGAASEEALGIRLIVATAAAQSAAGLNKLGVLHEEGLLPGEAPDARRAAQLFAASAATGNALGLLYHGCGLLRDAASGAEEEAAAVRALEASANLAPDDGAEEAAYQLWLLRRPSTTTRRGRAAPPPRPARWLRLAAELGHAAALEAVAQGHGAVEPFVDWRPGADLWTAAPLVPKKRGGVRGGGGRSSDGGGGGGSSDGGGSSSEGGGSSDDGGGSSDDGGGSDGDGAIAGGTDEADEAGSGVELAATWRLLQAVGAAPPGMREGLVCAADVLAPEELRAVTREARGLAPAARPIEGPYGQGRLWAAFPADSAAAALLCCDALAARVSAWVHEPVLAATALGVELRVYRRGAEMAWHTDELLFAAPQYELVLTLWNDSDSRTEWVDADGRTRSEWTRPGSALLVRAESAAHRVTPVTRGERAVLKVVFTPTLERPRAWARRPKVK